LLKAASFVYSLSAEQHRSQIFQALGLHSVLEVLTTQNAADVTTTWSSLPDSHKDKIKNFLVDELTQQPIDLSKLTQSEKEKEILTAVSTQIFKNTSPLVLQKLSANAPDTMLYFMSLQLQTENGLDTVLLALAAKNQKNKTSWQFLSKNAPQLKEQILELLTQHLEAMDTKSLIKYGEEIRNALYTKNKYHGVCKYGSMFGKYGRTDLWQILLETTQRTLRKRDADKEYTNDAAFSKIMNEKLKMKCC